MSAEPCGRIIVGTGATAMAAAMAFKQRLLPSEAVDVGYDLDMERQQMIAPLAGLDPPTWKPTDRVLLFPPPVAFSRGVEKRFCRQSRAPVSKRVFVVRIESTRH